MKKSCLALIIIIIQISLGVCSAEQNNKKCKNFNVPFLMIVPYLGIDEKALVISPLYNQDVFLLKQRQIIEKKFDYKTPPIAMIQLSGLTSAVIKSKLKNDNIQGYIDTTELDFASYLNNWTTIFINLFYNNQPPKISGNINNTNIFLDRVFITFGNLSVSPFYTTLGKKYVPFGQYNSFMISGSIAQTIGKTEASSILIGYQHPGESGLYSSIYFLNGVKKFIWDNNQQLITGLTTGYNYVNSTINADMGIDYIESISVSQGLQNLVGINNYAKKIPGLGIHAKCDFGNFTFIAEHITAMSRFNENLIAYKNHGAKPAASNFELGYQLKTFSHPSSIAMGYGKTYEATELDLPAQRFISTYSISFTKNIIGGIEYQHNIPDLDRNTILLRLMVYF